MSEQAVLGALLRDNSLVSVYPLDATDFEDQQNAMIYRAIRELVAQDRPAGVDGVVTRLQETTNRDYLVEVASLAANAIGTANIRVYVKEVRSKAALRKIREIGLSLAAITDKSEAEGHISKLLSIDQTQMNFVSDIQAAAVDAVNLLEELREGKRRGLTTGIRALDHKLGGLQPSDLIVIAARSQHGKTAFMLNMANAQQVPVGLISGEQPNVQLGMRAISQLGGVSLKDMRTGNLTEGQWSGVDLGLKKVSDRRIYTMDKGNPSIHEIVGQARQWAHHQGIKALFVDYLQLVSGGGGYEHRLQVGDVVYQLKALAKELDIPVVALAQVGRAIDSLPEGDNYTGRMPFANHLADSAKIEDAADQIVTIYRPEVYWPFDHLEGVTYLNVCKNRHGPTGYVMARWDGEFVRFSDAGATI